MTKSVDIISKFKINSTSVNVEKNKKLTLEETEQMIRFEKERHARLIGQLKAAEARNRLLIQKKSGLKSLTSFDIFFKFLLVLR